MYKDEYTYIWPELEKII